MRGGHSGEGIVIKNYGFRNKHGRQTWAKIVTSEFRAKHQKTMGAPVKTGASVIELQIADQYVSLALCEKVQAKIEVECGGWSKKYIPRLLNTVFQDVVQEEIWHILKKHKNPTIDFKKLKAAVSMQIKSKMPEVF